MSTRRSSKDLRIPSLNRGHHVSLSQGHSGSDTNTNAVAASDAATNTVEETASSTRESNVYSIYSIDDDDDDDGDHDTHSHSDSDVEHNDVDRDDNPDGTDGNHGHSTSSGRWDRLRFDRFVGREDELERLNSIYACICRKSSKTSAGSGDDITSGAKKGDKEAQVVLIHGYSGTGKSALVNRFLGDLGVKTSPLDTVPPASDGSDTAVQMKVEKTKRQSDMHPCHVGKGKYDQFNNAGNLSAIVDALSSFFEHLGETGEADDVAERNRIRDTIRNKMDDAQCDRMCKLILGLSNMFDSNYQSNLQIAASGNGASEEQEWAQPHSKPFRMMNRNNHNATTKPIGHTTSSIEEQSVGAKSMTTVSLLDADQRVGVRSREKEWPRLVHGFKVILKAICTNDRPLVLYLDDLQWVDGQSLKLITEILLDPSIRNLLMIGSYRSNEVHNDPQHHLTTAVSQWQTNGKTVHDIPLNDLTVTQTAELLASSLRLDTITTAPLAKLLHDKTQGNVFYIIQALEGLRRRKVLTCSIQTMQWEWDEKRAADEMDLSANVVDLIISKLYSLPEDMQKCLQMASFLRSTFRQSLLETLVDWEMEGRQVHQAADAGTRNTLAVAEMSVGEALSMAVKEELLERIEADTDRTQRLVDSGATFRFAHDRIQQAAFSLTPPGDELDRMKYRIGKYLMEIASDPMLGEDWMWFMAADHLENVSSLTVSDHIIPAIDLVHLNLKAGQLAISVTALVPAVKYLNRALTNLEIKIADPWKTQHNLCRDVYHSLSETELTLGNYDKGLMLCQTIVTRSDQAMEDKILMNLSLAKALNRLERFKESLDLQLQSLKLLETVPVRNHLFLALRDFQKINAYFSKHTDDEVMNLSVTMNPKMKLTMEILEHAGFSAHCSNQIGTLIFILFRQVRLTLKHGLCAEGAYAFCCAGIIFMNVFKKIRLGKRLAALSRRIIDVTESKYLFGRYILAMETFVDSWSQPVHVCLADLRRGQQDAMETGDPESAYRCWAISLILASAAGLPLIPLCRVMKSLLGQAQHYGLKILEDICVPAHDMSMILCGKNDLTVSLTQENWKSLVDSISVKDTDPSEWIKWMYKFWGCMQLATYFGELQVAKKCIGPLEHLCKAEHSMMVLSLKAFHSGLTMSRLAQRIAPNSRKRRKYYRRSNQHIRIMRGFIETKGGTSLHRYMIMQADAMAASGKESEEAVKAAYDKAISFSARSGHIHETALANELAAEYFLNNQPPINAARESKPGDSNHSAKIEMGKANSTGEDDIESYWPRQYLGNAISLYNEWGAKAKVEHLLEKYPILLDRGMIEDSVGGDTRRGMGTGRRRKRSMMKHTAATRMCVTTAHKIMAEVNFDAL